MIWRNWTTGRVDGLNSGGCQVRRKLYEVILADSFYVFLILVLLISFYSKEKRKGDNNLYNSKYLYYMK